MSFDLPGKYEPDEDVEEDLVLSVKARESVLLSIIDVVGRDLCGWESPLLCIAARIFVVIGFDASLCMIMMAVILVCDIAVVKIGAFGEEHIVVATSQ